ncbi:MarR family winged helix-turn-helix transcriptional regulator [Zhengella sp. ZM62]|uniref:MarR family winged helix-turn-helix transcriptional regulator n=1 Tax=Zhengella sedimenti TaxID=3390035 RepID=UPI0039749BF1
MAAIDPDALGFLLNDISRLIRASMDRAHAQSGIGVTPGEARVLAFAARTGPVRQTRLAEQIGVEAMTLSGHLDGLEGKGLIARQADPSDRRAKIVTLQPAADAVLEAIGATGRAIRAQASAGFDDEEWEQLKAALKRIRSNLSEKVTEASDAA